MNKKKTGVSRLFEIAGEKKPLLALSGIASSISAVFMLAPFLAIYKILTELLNNVGNIKMVNSEILIKWGWIAFICLIIGLIFMYGSLMASHIAAFRILYGLRVKLSTHIGKLSLGYLTANSTGAIKKTLEQNVEKIENFVTHTIPDMISAAATVIVLLGFMLTLNLWMALACLLSFIIGLAIQASMVLSEDARNRTKLYYDSLEKVNASAVEYVRGMPVVKIFGQTVRSFRGFYDDINEYRKYVLMFTDQMRTAFVLFKVLTASFLTFILPVGLICYSLGDKGIAFALTYLFFIVMGPGAAAPIFKLTMLASSTKDINEGVSRIDKIFNEEPIKEVEKGVIPTSYDVSFENVTFSYDMENASTRKDALKNVSFTAKGSEITALVGPSGSGKSTVANLIPRFYDVNNGSIKIGNVDIRNIKTEKLMDIVSFVFQDTFLFHDTLYENIKVGKPDATREEVIAAAKAAECNDFIEKLPNGYDTLIGQEGVYLSGGEEQRVSIARAILKNSPILVLDEATAFADPENEQKIQLALKELIKNKTVIMIAHRLSSIKDSNQIVVMKEGSLEEKGTHSELINLNGLYSKMWSAYTNAYNWTFEKGGVSSENV